MHVKGSTRVSIALMALVIAVASAWAAEDQPGKANDASKAAEAKPGQEGDDAVAESEVDRLAIAKMLYRDKHYDRARLTLQEIPVDDPKIDLKDYYTLRGLIALQQSRHRDAIESFELAIYNGQTEEQIWIYMAQSYFALEQWDKAIQMINNSGDSGSKVKELWLMKAQAQLNLQRRWQAWETLSDAKKRFPDYATVDRQRFFLLVEMGLYQSAQELGLDYLKRSDTKPEDYIAIAQAFKENREVDRALEILEEARLRFPGNEKYGELVAHLAYTYVEDEKVLAGADLLQRAALTETRFVKESAELYRRASSFERAMFMNAQVGKQDDKFKQRIAILVDRENFERIAGIDRRVRRLGLREDQAVAYALAYAHFKTGDFRRAETWLKQISDPRMFENATQLRRVMSLCRANPDQCE